MLSNLEVLVEVDRDMKEKEGERPCLLVRECPLAFWVLTNSDSRLLVLMI